ncbi:hypothetical protein PQQ52_11485 [Paraburkholderia sediminicola]|uniref:hypothetical protein n=1 Tax=Paraburkholderia sediminicola TaxID=458836 RepID=UPI0038BB08E0
MEYDDLIATAIRGRSVNGLAKTWGLPQKTLENYVKGKSLPSYTALSILAREAGISTAEAVQIMIAEEHRRKESKEIFSPGFRLLTSALSSLFTRDYAV